MALKKLFKDRWDKKIAGVFGGLGQYFHMDPNILRLIALYLIIPTGIVVLPLIYLFLALVMPQGPINYIQPRCRKLYLIKEEQVILGVCAGVAKFLGFNVMVVRAIFVCLFFITGFFPLLIAYFVAGSLLPIKPSH